MIHSRRGQKDQLILYPYLWFKRILRIKDTDVSSCFNDTYQWDWTDYFLHEIALCNRMWFIDMLAAGGREIGDKWSSVAAANCSDQENH